MWLIPLCVATLLWACVRLFRHLTSIRNQRRNGCDVPPKYPHLDPVLGLDYWHRQKTAAARSQWLPASKELFARHGKTYEVNNLGERMIHTMESRNIQSVWALDFQSWGLQPLREGIAEPFFGRGINTTDGEFWRHSRALIRPTFTRTAAVNLDFLGKHVDRLIEQLPTNGPSVDLQPLLSCLILDASTEFLFGESMDSLLPEQRGECMTFIRAFDYCLYGVGARVRLGQLRFLHRDRKWRESIRVVHDRVDLYIEKSIRKAQSSVKIADGDDDGDDKSKRYVLMDEMARQTQDKLDLRSQILAVFMPGRDSTAHALSNVFHVLARRPDVYAKLREDVMQFGDAELTFELLKSMKYLQWTLNEGLRTHPTTAQSYRKALNDTQLPTGGGKDGLSPIFIRKGDTVMASMWALHQDTDIWGPDAAEFRPERWQGLKPIWTFVPFLGGPRTCPAQQLVLTQEAYVLARFARVFSRIENVDPNPWTEARRIGFQSKYGVQVKLHTETCDVSSLTLESEVVDQLLRFWLPTYPTPSSSWSYADVLRWFTQSDAVDKEVRRIVGPVVEALGTLPLPPFEDLEKDRTLYPQIAAPFVPLLRNNALAALALVLISDQMPRNLFRDEAQAVVYTHYDRIARAISSHIRSSNIDEDSCFCSPTWGYWLYLPLEHSESLKDHEDFARILQKMLERARDCADDSGVEFVKRAIEIESQHLEPIKLFGRFPWRNRWLGRKSTPAEMEWLREGGYRI